MDTITNFQTVPAREPSAAMPPPPSADDAKTRAEGNHKKLVWLQGLFEREILLQADERREKAKDEDFYDGHQWDDADRLELEQRGQPPLVFNEVKPMVDWILGAEMRARIDWRIAPRNDQDVEPAIRKTKLFKYISDINKATWQRSAAFKDVVKVGEGWLEYCVELDECGCPGIVVRSESWRNMWADSSSVIPGLDDARFIFRTKLVDLDIAQAMFPDKARALALESAEREQLEEEDRQSTAMGSYGASTFLRAGSVVLGTVSFGSREAVRLVECWYRVPAQAQVMRGDGRLHGMAYDPNDQQHVAAVGSGQLDLVQTSRMEMRVAIFAKGILLLDMPSPYSHRRFPFVREVAFRKGRNNATYGTIRNVRDPQEDLNKRRSKALHLMSTRRVVMDEGAVDDEDLLAEEVARPDGIIKKRTGKALEIQENQQLADGHVRFAEQDGAYIRQTSGVTGENLGMQTNATTGVAINARAEQGTIVTTPLFDSHRLAFQLGGELLLSLSEQFMTEEMQFRITGDQGRPEFVSINDGTPETDITAQESHFVVDEEDYRTTIRAALAEQLLTLAGNLAQRTGNPQLAISFVDMAVNLTDIPNKKDILARIRQVTGLPDPDEAPEVRQQREQASAQKQQQDTDLALRERIAKIKLIEAQASAGAGNAVASKLMALKTAVDAAVETLVNAGAAPMADQMLANIDQLIAGTGALQPPAAASAPAVPPPQATPGPLGLSDQSAP